MIFLVYSFLEKVYLLEKQRRRERGGERSRERKEIFYLLFNFPNGCSGQRWAMPKSRTWSFLVLPCGWQWPKPLGYLLLLSQACQQVTIGSVAAGTGMGGGIAGVDLNGCIIKSSSYLLICNFETCCIVFKINSWGWCSGIAS